MYLYLIAVKVWCIAAKSIKLYDPNLLIYIIARLLIDAEEIFWLHRKNGNHAKLIFPQSWEI